MDTIVEIVFEYGNHRAQKARIGKFFDKFWRALFIVLASLLFIGGVALVVLSIAAGWFLVGLSLLPFMYILWWYGELRNLAPSKKPTSLADVLSADILARLSRKPTAGEIANIVTSTNGGYFLGARFGLTANLINELISQDLVNVDTLWKDALELMNKLDAHTITPGMLIACMFKQLPNTDALLAHLHLEYSDVISGLEWQQHLSDLIAFHAGPKRTGGIARDWSFGYIPLLSRFGRNISHQVSGGILNVEIDSHQKSILQLIETFASGGTQNIALVGKTGVGKTTLVEAFAEKILDAKSSIPNSLKFRQVIMLDAGSLIAAAPGKGQIEELVMEILGEAYAAKNIIICFDNAQLFFEEGVGSVDITNVLLPIIEAGNLRMIFAMDEQRYLQIGARNPSVVNALNRVSIAPATKQETMRVMQDQLIQTEFKRKVTYTYQSLAEAYRLSERYVYDIAMPGQALKLLNSAASYSQNGLITINSVQEAIEQTLDIKVSVASEAEDRDKLLNLEELIHQRMINQTRAVTAVSDALRRARAGVRNEDRPIGTFLFLGPTGVGKTELAKALADVYFGGEGRIIRLDLNEYVRNEDVARLIADGSTDSSSLTARVMKQPYSVVLLDEIEKAHPNVLTTLLQLLDEGILRDINNREISFRDTIVIATSNAGSDRIREYIGRGYKLEQFEQQFTDELISSGQFKPEFLNRFDEIVTFTPLTKNDLMKVVDLMIAGVNKTLAQQKISVSVEQDTKLYLVERGYDPRLGARPMRRIVQRSVENTMAKLMLGGSVAPGSVVEITLDQVKTILGPQQEAAAIIEASNADS